MGYTFTGGKYRAFVKSAFQRQNSSVGVYAYSSEYYFSTLGEYDFIDIQWYTQRTLGGGHWLNGASAYNDKDGNIWFVDYYMVAQFDKTLDSLIPLDCTIEDGKTPRDALKSQYMWEDGDHLYSSYTSDTQYELDKKENVWKVKTWNGLTPSGNHIWKYGDNVYHSYDDSQYILNKETDTWIPISWDISYLRGEYIWSDGQYTYCTIPYTYRSETYRYDPLDNDWYYRDWDNLNPEDRKYIWEDNNGNIYYSHNTSQYILDKNINDWVAITWNGFSNLDGNYVWTDGENIYYSYNYDRTTSTYYHYILDMDTHTWNEYEPLMYDDDFRPYRGKGEEMWNDKYNNIYYTNNDHNLNYVLAGVVLKNKSYRGYWAIKTWNNLPSSFDGSCVWSDFSGNTYYSSGRNQYKLNDSIEKPDTWDAITWNGNYKYPYGNRIWKDEASQKIYYDYPYSAHYILNTQTNSWDTNTWKGLSTEELQSFEGSHIWSYNGNIYHSWYSYQHILDRATNTWNSITWNISIAGDCIWKDMEGKVYYLDSSNYNNDYHSYTLDNATQNWIEKPFEGFPETTISNQYKGHYIWTDGEHLFFSNGYRLYLIYALKNEQEQTEEAEP